MVIMIETENISATTEMVRCGKFYSRRSDGQVARKGTRHVGSMTERSGKVVRARDRRAGIYWVQKTW